MSRIRRHGVDGAIARIRDAQGRAPPGVRGTPLDASDPLADEWVIIVIGTHFTAALVARNPTSLESQHWGYEYAITYDRGLVIAAAQNVIHRIDSR